MMYKPRKVGMTRSYLITLVSQMRYEGKTETTLGLWMLKEDNETLCQYLSILDELKTTTTYRVVEDKEKKFQGYMFTIKIIYGKG